MGGTVGFPRTATDQGAVGAGRVWRAGRHLSRLYQRVRIAAGLSSWCRLPGLYDCDDLKDAEPDTLRYRLWTLPGRLVRHARARVLKPNRTWPWKEAFLACWQRLCTPPAPA